ncbi:MAG: membrane-bound PQQ-dependent dehydrogenase, glucose/quinate/shikimate family, partial [Phenylobacterium zucineum]
MTDAPKISSQGHAWFARTVGVLLVLIGAILAAGGLWLALVRGSPYYLLAGLGLIASGALMVRRRVLGAWVYVGVFAATLPWALWESGLNGWALIPRLFGPFILLLLVAACVPDLTRDRAPRRASLSLALGASALMGGLVIAVLLAGRPPAPGAPTLGAAPLTAAAAGADWPAYGGTYGAQRYSTLAQITPANAGRLERAWLVHTGDLPATAEARARYGAETTPLKVGASLYLCTPKNVLMALDAATGKTRWRFDPKVADIHIPYTAACRGVAYYAVPTAHYGDVCATRIIEGTLDARLIAVDAATGRPCPDFGFGGQVDTTQGIGQNVPGM